MCVCVCVWIEEQSPNGHHLHGQQTDLTIILTMLPYNRITIIQFDMLHRHRNRNRNPRRKCSRHAMSTKREYMHGLFFFCPLQMESYPVQDLESPPPSSSSPSSSSSSSSWDNLYMMNVLVVQLRKKSCTA